MEREGKGVFNRTCDGVCVDLCIHFFVYLYTRSTKYIKCLPPGLTSTLASSAMACLREMEPITSMMEAGWSLF